MKTKQINLIALTQIVTLLLLSSLAFTAKAATQEKGSVSMSYSVTEVSFESQGETLYGQLFLPAGEGPFPAVSIVGPVAFVKEQAPLQYASRLVQQGFATLIFDPRYHGASTGEPRRFESGEAKVEDLMASFDFLEGQPSIDNNRLGLVGICQGVNWAIETAIKDERVKSLAIVAGHYLTPEVAAMYLGSEEKLNQRITRSDNAKREFEENGEVEYIEITGSDEALLTIKAIDDWYQPWANHAPWMAFRGQWENRITAMSEADIWTWRIDQSLVKLQTPVKMIHADHAASGSEVPKILFANIPAKTKSLSWIENANQFMFYENPIVIDQAVVSVSEHLNETLN